MKKSLSVAAALVLTIGSSGAARAASDPGLDDQAKPNASSDGPLRQGTTLTAPPTAAPANGGTSAESEPSPEPEETEDESAVEPIEESPQPETPSSPAEAFTIPSLPESACAPTGVPPVLIPIYQAASTQYALGPQGPAILAGINAIETNFGQNLGPSYAGAVGWMQFMPATWSEYGLDANGDGVADPNNPEDAIYAAASYLSAAGMPADTYGAIFAYNHADWYVSDVLANAGCYAHEVGDPAFTSGSLGPQIEVLHCDPAAPWRKQIPADYLEAFEEAAGRYELGRRGVWALAAIARLESNFGRGMSKHQLHTEGPLGLDPSEWKRYAVDGDRDGHVRHGDIADSAATLARLIWSHGSLEAGVFAHNQAEWYVQQVVQGAEEIGGACKVTYMDWRVAPPEGRVFIQTYESEATPIVCAANHDYRGFYENEIGHRRRAGYPPFIRIVRLVYHDRDYEHGTVESSRVASELRLKRDAAGRSESDILGPMTPYIPRVRNAHRWQILLRGRAPLALLEGVRLGTSWTVDVDPSNLL